MKVCVLCVCATSLSQIPSSNTQAWSTSWYHNIKQSRVHIHKPRVPFQSIVLSSSAQSFLSRRYKSIINSSSSNNMRNSTQYVSLSRSHTWTRLQPSPFFPKSLHLCGNQNPNAVVKCINNFLFDTPLDMRRRNETIKGCNQRGCLHQRKASASNVKGLGLIILMVSSKYSFWIGCDMTHDPFQGAFISSLFCIETRLFKVLVWSNDPA